MRGSTRARRMRALCVVGLGLAPSLAAAYSSPALYAADPARTGGGGGRGFSGSPTDGYTCAVCHTGGEPPAPTIRGGPGGAYTPGATYQFEVAWPNEHLGVVLEATDRAGLPLGVLVLPPNSAVEDGERCAGGSRAAESIALADAREAVAAGDCGAHLLRVQWTAPPEHVAGAIHVAAVAADGDGTPAGDGAAAWTIEVGPLAPAGCAIAGPGAWFGWVALLFARRRRGRRVAGVGVAMMLSIGTGCARVQPYQRGRLAQPDMQLEGDGDLEAGPEHALEYREGSAGGLGGGGGGCGCN